MAESIREEEIGQMGPREGGNADGEEDLKLASEAGKKGGWRSWETGLGEWRPDLQFYVEGGSYRS